MRLIDADEFKKQVAGMSIVNNYPADKANKICELIDCQKTAFDVDKVVERLEQKREKYRTDAHIQMYKHKNEYWAQYLDGMQCGIRDSIEILKSGGID